GVLVLIVELGAAAVIDPTERLLERLEDPQAGVGIVGVEIAALGDPPEGAQRREIAGADADPFRRVWHDLLEAVEVARIAALAPREEALLEHRLERPVAAVARIVERVGVGIGLVDLAVLGARCLALEARIALDDASAAGRERPDPVEEGR